MLVAPKFVHLRYTGLDKQSHKLEFVIDGCHLLGEFAERQQQEVTLHKNEALQMKFPWLEHFNGLISSLLKDKGHLAEAQSLESYQLTRESEQKFKYAVQITVRTSDAETGEITHETTDDKLAEIILSLRPFMEELPARFLRSLHQESIDSVLDLRDRRDRKQQLFKSGPQLGSDVLESLKEIAHESQPIKSALLGNLQDAARRITAALYQINAIWKSLGYEHSRVTDAEVESVQSDLCTVQQDLHVVRSHGLLSRMCQFSDSELDVIIKDAFAQLCQWLEVRSDLKKNVRNWIANMQSPSQQSAFEQTNVVPDLEAGVKLLVARLSKLCLVPIKDVIQVVDTAAHINKWIVKQASHEAKLKECKSAVACAKKMHGDLRKALDGCKPDEMYFDQLGVAAAAAAAEKQLEISKLAEQREGLREQEISNARNALKSAEKNDPQAVSDPRIVTAEKELKRVAEKWKKVEEAEERSMEKRSHKLAALVATLSEVLLVPVASPMSAVLTKPDQIEILQIEDEAGRLRDKDLMRQAFGSRVDLNAGAMEEIVLIEEMRLSWIDRKVKKFTQELRRISTLHSSSKTHSKNAKEQKEISVSHASGTTYSPQGFHRDAAPELQTIIELLSKQNMDVELRLVYFTQVSSRCIAIASTLLCVATLHL